MQLPIPKTDPVEPFKDSALALTVLALVAALLVALTVWTYLGVPGTSVKRILTVLGLRLAALVLACLSLVGPSLAFRSDLYPPSVLLIAVDDSESMTNQDEFDGKSRWQNLLRNLRQSEPILKQLRDERNVTVFLYRFAGDVGDFDPEGKAAGDASNFGQMLSALYDKHGQERQLRSLLVLSDGAHNGPDREAQLAAARPWRQRRCPIHTFAFGDKKTSDRERDIVLAEINPEPSPVPIKGELTVRGTIHAYGFGGAKVRVHLFINDKPVHAQDEWLNLAPRDEPLSRTVVTLKCQAPHEPGEFKVTLKVDPKDGELSVVNNEISTYLTATKEGLSVLLIDTPRFPEPQLICDALRTDRRFRLFTAWIRGNQPLDVVELEKDLFHFDKQRYNVVILGDLRGDQLRLGHPQALKKIHDFVHDRGMGLLMMGGDDSFGSTWHKTPIADLLPVDLGIGGRIDAPVKMLPAEAGSRRIVMRLGDTPEDSAARWKAMRDLDGMNRLGKLKDKALVLAETKDGTPILVGHEYGAGRTMALAADTTWRWTTDEDGYKNHARFWQQLVLWLARQDETEGKKAWVKLDQRRLEMGKKLGFSVGLRGKSDLEAKDPEFDVKLVSPQNVETPLNPVADKGQYRGLTEPIKAPGEYSLVVSAKGTDVDGTPVEGTAEAHFLVYPNEPEMARRSANHKFLEDLSAAGGSGGKLHKGSELVAFLQELVDKPDAQAGTRAAPWPDWRRKNLSVFHVGFFLLFVGLLGLEWFLRRRWGMV